MEAALRRISSLYRCVMRDPPPSDFGATSRCGALWSLPFKTREVLIFDSLVGRLDANHTRTGRPTGNA